MSNETICYLDSERVLCALVESERVKYTHNGGRMYSLYKFLETQCGISRNSRAFVERTGVISPIIMQRLLSNESLKAKLLER